jgi:hypothetical protein
MQLALFHLARIRTAGTCVTARRARRHHHGPELPFPARRPYPFDRLERRSGLAETPLCKALRISWRILHLYREIGLTWDQADRCAGRLGWHPADIWPDIWGHDTDPDDPDDDDPDDDH